MNILQYAGLAGSKKSKAARNGNGGLLGLFALILVLFMVVAPLRAFALDTDDQEFVPVPKFTNYVVDEAQMLSPDERAALIDNITKFADAKGSQIAVLTVPTTGIEDPFDFAIRVTDEWKVGRKGIDDGIFILVVKDTRRIQILVGYGLEGKVTDGISANVIDKVMAPAFRNGNFGQGIINAVDTFEKLINEEELPEYITDTSGAEGNVDLAPVLIVIAIFAKAISMIIEDVTGDGVGGQLFSNGVGASITLVPAYFLGVSLFLAFVIYVMVFIMFKFGEGGGGGGGTYTGGGWGSGGGGGWSGGGGGFGGGRGGGFGGGGASGGW